MNIAFFIVVHVNINAESVLVESNSIVDSKDLYVKESEKLVEEMSNEVDHLQSVLLAMKVLIFISSFVLKDITCCTIIGMHWIKTLN